MKKFGLCLTLLVFTHAYSVVSEELSVVATTGLCQKLVVHTPADGVAFTPGADVQGRPVVSADLPNESGLAKALPKVFEFPVSVNPLRGAAANRFGETKLDLGQIRFDAKTGAVTYHGQSLQGVAYGDFVQKCQDMLKKHR